MIPKVLLAVKLDPLLDRDEADLAMEPGPPATAPAIDLPPAGSLNELLPLRACPGARSHRGRTRVQARRLEGSIRSIGPGSSTE